MAKNGLPHHLETFDFIAMYAYIPVKCLQRIMGELLDLVFTYQEQKVVPNRCTLRTGSKMMKRKKDQPTTLVSQPSCKY